MKMKESTSEIFKALGFIFTGFIGGLAIGVLIMTR